MRDTFLADAQSALLALLFGDAVQAADYLDNLTGDEYTALYHATQRLAKMALERHLSYRNVPGDVPYDDISGDARNPD